MPAHIRKLLQRLTLAGLLGGVALGGAALVAAPGAPGTAAPLPAAPAVPGVTLPSATCVLSGSTRTCDLWAKQGKLALPGGTSVTIWGYATSQTGAAQLPGPTLIANQGETLKVNLHNQLTDASSLDFPSQALVPDRAGAGPNASKTYSLTLSRPGTSVYQAGLTPNGQRQVAMGLFGALVVRPPAATCSSCVYTSTAPNDSTFDDEALVVFSEVDPALNANPSTFDLRTFSPKYWLLNGKAFPQTDPIATSPGHKLAIRYVNAGLMDHSVGLLGLRQTVLSTGSQPLNWQYQVVDETIPAGQSLDALATIPMTTTTAKYALYEAANHLDNAGTTRADGTIATGGMLTFLTAMSGTTTGSPLTSNVLAAPNPTDGSAAVTVTATVSESNGSITAAEYSIDSLAAAGAGTPMSPSSSFGAASVNVTSTISAATVGALAAGGHPIYVRGKDAANTWGVASSTVLQIQKGGPTTSGVTVAPNPTNGSSDLTLQATADDTASGNANVDDAEYFIDSAANGVSKMTLGQAAPVTSLSATIPAATVKALAEGQHTVSVRSHDVLGHWGSYATTKLNIDKTGPATSNVVAAPNPNNGTLPIDINTTDMQVRAHVSDPLVSGVNSNVVAAELFLDNVGPDGSGAVFLPGNGTWGTSTTMDPYVRIPLSGIQALSEGNHTFYVHGKDAAGNWGPMATTTLIVDKTGPVTSNVNFTPRSATRTPPNNKVTIQATAADPVLKGRATGSNIAAAEWFDGADPGPGNGNPMAATDGAFNSPFEALIASNVDVSTWTPTAHKISVRARDAAGNWGTPSSATLTVR